MRCARLVRDPVLSFFQLSALLFVCFCALLSLHIWTETETNNRTHTRIQALDTRTSTLAHTTFAFQSLALLTAAPAAAAARAARCCCRSCVCLCPPARRWSFYSPLSLDSFFTWHFSTFPFAIVISAFVGCVCVCECVYVGGVGERVDGWLRAWSILLSCFLFKTICLA